MKMLRSLIGLLIIAAGIYLGWRLIPVYFANYQLEEAFEDAARDDMVQRHSEDEIRANVLKQAHSLQVPLRDEDLNVQRTPDNEVMIWSDYTVHIDAPLYPFDLHFQAASRSKKRMM